ncbi:hypothetical protein GCM10011371_00340 [Novosphingobium marinum]|uniref:6-phosphofructokinase n=1 Tax=Novosphingobium marinum TaxID=1514948 RepID=A0A7Z0BRC9_9SPHN|nr:hypothetical protein [Novosphingobium marinum]NYH93726.1 hypothetical protein [Novosphingobium marinum]GGC16844.1 hypothetical protein GCM10011371_00340 [Novosphingobium marinum]
MTSAENQEFPYAPGLSASDDGNHAPGEGDKWQESSLVAYCDPSRGLAGFHRIGIHPNLGEASVYSWLQIDGRMVSQAKRTNLPIPAGPVTGTTLEGVTFRTPDPLRTCEIEVERDGVHAEVLFESFTGPVQMNMDVGGATVGKGHYDSIGRVTGKFSAGSEQFAFDGVGFLDHSWGPRDAGGILAHRWMMAALDAGNHINTFPTIGPRGRAMLGYVMLDGELSFTADVSSELSIGDDHLDVRAARARITDEFGRTVEINGVSAGEYSIQPYGQGYFCAHKPMVWNCRGRTWPGMLEWSAIRFVPPWHRERLGIEKDNSWLKWDGDQP